MHSMVKAPAQISFRFIRTSWKRSIVVASSVRKWHSKSVGSYSCVVRERVGIDSLSHSYKLSRNVQIWVKPESNGLTLVGLRDWTDCIQKPNRNWIKMAGLRFDSLTDEVYALIEIYIFSMQRIFMANVLVMIFKNKYSIQIFVNKITFNR